MGWCIPQCGRRWPITVVHTQVARGSWIHTRSIVRHHALGAAGATAIVRAVVVRRFEAHGERAVLDVVIEVDGVLVALLNTRRSLLPAAAPARV
jgi:hypothetical protein